MKNTFLMEILTEELPAKELKHLAEKLLEQVIKKLYCSSVTYGKTYWFASPRRLAIKITNIKITKRRNLYFSNKKTIPYKDIKNKKYHSYKFPQKNSDKIKQFVLKKKIKKLLYSIIRDILLNFKELKRMKLDNTKIAFVRPIHGIILLFNDQLINGKILDIRIDRISYGHRFIGKRKIYLEHANHYSKILLKEKVIVDFFKRKEKIIFALQNISKKIGGILNINEKSLEEIVALTEWPIILYSSFDKKFLSIPKEILIFLLEEKQKCFPVFDNFGNLLPYFIFVINIEPKNQDKIIFMYKNVIHSCFSNIKFLLNIDRKKKLIDQLHNLKKITFHKLLGSLEDKSKRIEQISGSIAELLSVNKKHASRAGLLCKCDLTTNVVTEFPDMRGIIGMYYSMMDNESKEVSTAQKDYYYPRFSNDILPNTMISCIIAIADRIDSIVGMIGIGEIPKRGNDPFALRRAAIGIIRIILEKKLKINLFFLIKNTIEIYKNKLRNKNVDIETYNFISNRLFSFYIKKGYNKKVIQSVTSLFSYQNFCLLDSSYRILIMQKLFIKNEISVIIMMYKRVNNILKNYGSKDINKNINFNLLVSIEEINISNFLLEINKKIPTFIKNFEYNKVLTELKKLCVLLDAFFKHVLIMTENVNLKKNRLTILKLTKEKFISVADFSKL